MNLCGGVIMRSDLSKAFAEITSKATDKPDQYDYSHLLPEQYRSAGWGLVVYHQATDSNKEVAAMAVRPAEYDEEPISARGIGGVYGQINPGSWLRTHASPLPMKHRGKGLGRAMYEAAIAHAHNHFAVQHVGKPEKGSRGSAAAVDVHRRLAQKHGLNINVKPVVSDEADDDQTYSYTIKSDQSLLAVTSLLMASKGLQKAFRAPVAGLAIPQQPSNLKNGPGLTKAISELSVGQHQGDRWDYSHLLTPLHRATGYRLHVFHNLTPGHDAPLRAALIHGTEEVGEVVWLKSLKHDGALEPHANIDNPHNGKGLGRRMYEAALAHAYHVGGFKTVAGGSHSKDASLVHQSLASKHGVAYTPAPTQDLGGWIRGQSA